MSTSIPSFSASASDAFSDARALSAALAATGYLADDETAMVSWLALRLGKPLLLEGPAGTGKTQLALALAESTGRTIIRMQCYEGLDESKALYEWDYRRQLLRIQSAVDGTEWSEIESSVFGEEFLLSRPLLAAIRSPEPVVLLIDEVDRLEPEMEALLLEVLGEFQVSIPELSTIRATSRPIVVLTSNGTRELSEALRRRCLFHYLGYPDPARESAILRSRVAEASETLTRSVAEAVAVLRSLAPRKAPSISESIDWTRALLALGATELDEQLAANTLMLVLKSTEDLELARTALAERAAVSG